ncbi:MAG: TIGR00266 family protein [Magnetococcales bacterium]|nr:TIGR00266 family protein [Magnetococcales bacterium]MBF0437573.1 TIGR00266 family protein [Magnetococcales bacterium]
MAEFTITGEVDPFLHVSLQQGESILAESNAMVMMEETLILDGSLGNQGIFGALVRRMANEESIFQQKITAQNGPGDLLLAAPFPGGMHVFNVGDKQFYLADGAFLACTDGVAIKSVMQNLGHAMFGGTGGFLIQQSTGKGKLAVSAFGSVFLLDVKPGQPLTIDNEHVVAWDTNLTYEITTPNSGRGFLGGMVSAATSGESLVLRFSGQGQILLASRNKKTLISWLTENLPQTKN